MFKREFLIEGHGKVRKKIIYMSSIMGFFEHNFEHNSMFF